MEGLEYQIMAVGATYALVWAYCYWRTGVLERGEGHRALRRFGAAYGHTPLLFIAYVVVLVCWLETTLEAHYLNVGDIVVFKSVAAAIMFFLSHGVVPFDNFGVRLFFALYIAVPGTGGIIHVLPGGGGHLLYLFPIALPLIAYAVFRPRRAGHAPPPEPQAKGPPHV